MNRPMRGAATAELVVALPVLVLFTVALAWFVSLGIAQVQVVDAARESARAIARGDDRGQALARGRTVGPAGTRMRIAFGGQGVAGGAGQVRVTAVARISGPGGLLGLLPVTVRASAVAAMEHDAPAG